jgi:hypothetical protein
MDIDSGYRMTLKIQATSVNNTDKKILYSRSIDSKWDAMGHPGKFEIKAVKSLSVFI